MRTCRGHEILNVSLPVLLLFCAVRVIVVRESLVVRQHLLPIFVGADDGRFAVEQVDLFE